MSTRGVSRQHHRTARPVEPVTPLAPRQVRRTLFRQNWRDLVFLHWPADPFQVAGLLPPGTVPDLLNGRTYVGLVFFRLRDLAVGGTPAVPYVGSFDEVNVRLYSRDAQGRRGVVFRSLECDRLLPVLAADASFRLPYRWSRIRSQWFDTRLLYRTSRRGAPDARARVWLDVGTDPVAPDPVEEFLTNRWGLHGRAFGRSYYLPNTHPAWTFRRCALLDWEDSLIAAAGLSEPCEEPFSVLYAPGVPVRFGTPTVLPGT
ncbi:MULTISPECIES: YqjF family protein [unclassified Streptomyces]|uniref:YqjF family protein n=1 Tax=unclassified Streptomyces TaxID=2593676 RepID=UPI0036825C10